MVKNSLPRRPSLHSQESVMDLDKNKDNIRSRSFLFHVTTARNEVIVGANVKRKANEMKNKNIPTANTTTAVNLNKKVNYLKM